LLFFVLEYKSFGTLFVIMNNPVRFKILSIVRGLSLIL